MGKHKEVSNGTNPKEQRYGLRRCLGEEDRGTAKEEQERGKRGVQVCDADQSLGDTKGGKERKKGESTHAHRKCRATEGVKPGKRKGSDQRRDEAMGEEGGRHGEEWEVQSKPQGL